MAEIFTWHALGTSLLIFVVRVLSISMDTLRFMLTMRGKQAIAWVLGFVSTVLYVLTFNAVLKDLSNPLALISYSAGFATGNVVGMLIERKLAMGFTNMTIINKKNGFEIIQRCARRISRSESQDRHGWPGRNWSVGRAARHSKIEKL